MVTVVQCVNNLDVGGVEQLVLSLSGELRQRGCRVKICCIENEGALAQRARNKGLEVHALNMAERGKSRALRDFIDYVRTDKPIVIHSHNFKPGWYASAVRGFRVVAAHVHTKHGIYSVSSRGLWRYRWMRAGVDAFVAVSHESQEQLARYASLPVEQVRIVRNGVDVAEFRPSLLRDSLRAEMHIPSEQRIVVNVARLCPEKDVASLLHAFRQIRVSVPTAVLWLVGDGPERQRLEALAGDLRVAESVMFMGMRADIPSLLAVADLFCLSSMSEGMPMAVLEAMACGLPVVATDVGDVSRALLPGPCGGVVPPRNPSSLAAACVDVLQDAERRGQMGSRARSRAVEGFSLGVMASEYARLYEDLLNVNPPEGGAP